MLDSGEINKIARAVDRLMYDYDPLDYWNVIVNAEDNRLRIKEDIASGGDFTKEFLHRLASGEQEHELPWATIRARKLLLRLNRLE